MKSRNVILVMVVLLLAGFSSDVRAVDVTSQGNPFMTISQSLEDTDYFATGGPAADYARLTDGDNATTHDTWEDTHATWLYDGVGLQFASGLSGVLRFELDMQVFGDGGWYDSADAPVIIQVATDPAFGTVALTSGTTPGDDNIWITVPQTNDYPVDVKGDLSTDAGVPAAGTTFTFEMDFPGTIYGVRIVGNAGGSAGGDIGGFLAVQEIRVFTGDSTVRATAVAPTEGQTGIETATALLQWTPAQEGGVTDPNVVGHYVYLGTDPNAVLVSGVTALPVGTISFVPTLAKDTDYYWHVDELLDNGSVLKGYVYAFQTELTLPVIDTQPAGQFVKESYDAVFTIAVTDPLGGSMTYQWYYDADGVAGGEVALSDGVDYSGANSDELTVFAAELADEGYYSCVIDNGNSISTIMVKLDIARELYHWPLDGDGIEANGTGYDGVLQGGANFVLQGIEPNDISVVGSGALALNGVNAFLDIAGDVPMPAVGDVPGFTVSCWVNSPDLGRTLQGIVGKFGSDDNSQADDNFLLATAVPAYGGTDGIWVQHGTGEGATWAYASNILAVNEWVFVTFAYSAFVDFDVYINGEIVLNFEGHGTGYEDVSGDIRIGHKPATIINVDDTENFFKGRIDDVKIYNYSMDALEVATIYTDISGGSVCLEYPEFDLDESCKVDIVDIAMVAASWLECGLYPDCL